MKLKLCFLGIGKYRSALLRGIIKAKRITAEDIVVILAEDSKPSTRLPLGVKKCLNIQEAIRLGYKVIFVAHINELKGVKGPVTVFSTDPSEPPDAFDKNINIVYYMNNLATEVCKGIITIHIPDKGKENKTTKEIADLLFKPLGLVKELKSKDDLFGIQRLVSLSSIGIISYFLYSLGEGFKQIKPSLPDKEIEQSVEQSIQGILEFLKVKPKKDFESIYKESVIEEGVIDNCTQALQKIPEVISETYKQGNMGPQLETKIVISKSYLELLKRIEKKLMETWPKFEKDFKETGVIDIKKFCGKIFYEDSKENSLADLLLEFMGGRNNVVWCNPYSTESSHVFFIPDDLCKVTKEVIELYENKDVWKESHNTLSHLLEKLEKKGHEKPWIIHLKEISSDIDKNYYLTTDFSFLRESFGCLIKKQKDAYLKNNPSVEPINLEKKCIEVCRKRETYKECVNKIKEEINKITNADIENGEIEKLLNYYIWIECAYAPEEWNYMVLFSVGLSSLHHIPFGINIGLKELNPDKLILFSSLVYRILSVGVELKLKKQGEEVIKHSTKAAVAAIMARNMSHNIGSHVLVRNINDLKNRGEGEEADLSDYVRIRMSFIANILTRPPSWCVSEKLKKVLLPYTPEGIEPLRKHIVASEGYEDCYISDNSIEEIKETVAMPLAKTGRHALYSILENYIRNTAKHNKKSNEREIILKLSVEEDNNFPALYKITIWDNISDSGKLEEVSNIINEIQKVDDDNKKIFLQLIDEMGELLRRYWGFSEMLCCASFLRGISSKKMITPIDFPPLITPIKKEERVGLVFYLQKAKDLLLIDNNPALNNKEELLRLGIRIEGSSWLKENIDESGYNFVIINDEGLDEKEQKELRDLSSKLPYRTFYISSGFEKMNEVYEELKNILKNKDDSNSIINLLYEEWLKKISGGEIKEILSKILFVHENASSEIQDKLKNLNIKIECNTAPKAELANQKNEEKIIFEHHGYSRRDLPREACYYEAYGSDSAIDEGLKGLGGEELKKFIYKLIESALINILILDERLFDKFRDKLKDQKYLEAQGVTIRGDKENNYDVELKGGFRIKNIDNSKHYKFISIHKGIIDKLKEELKASSKSDLEVMEKFIGKIRKTKRFEYIIIHSDRGEPEKLPEGVKYLDYSNLEDLVASGEEASKFELTEAILCLI